MLITRKGSFEKYVANDIRIQVLQMIQNTKLVFKDVITSLYWMDEPTKRAAIEKVDAMIELIGYPDWIKDKRALEAYYSGVPSKLVTVYFKLYLKMFVCFLSLKFPQQNILLICKKLMLCSPGKNFADYDGH